MRRLHQCLGWGIGIYLAMVCLSGGFLLFKNPLLLSLYPSLKSAERAFSHARPTNVELAAQLENIIAQRQFVYIDAPTNAAPYFKAVTASKTNHYFSFDGELLLVRDKRSDLVSWLVEFHHSLLLGKTGKTLLGILSLLSVVLIISGFVHWWPKSFNKRLWKLPKTRHRSFKRQLHLVLGSTFGLLLLMPLLTGAAIVYSKSITSFIGKPEMTQSQFAQVNKQAFSQVDKANNMASSNQFYLSNAISLGAEYFEPARLRRVYPVQNNKSTLTMRFKRDLEWQPYGRNTLTFDVSTMAVIKLADTNANSTSLTWLQRMYPLHIGDVGGNTLFIFLLILALIGGVLMFSGLLYGWQRQKLKKPKVNNRNHLAQGKT